MFDAPSPLVLRAARPVGDQWRTLAEERGSGERFAPALAEHLPLAARRWSTCAVAAGTPLARSVRLDMSGQIRLGSWRPFTAVQLLVPATGFIWADNEDRARTGIGLRPVHRRNRRDAPANGRNHSGGVCHGRDVGDSAAGRLAGQSIFVPTAFPLARWAVDAERSFDGITIASRIRAEWGTGDGSDVSSFVPRSRTRISTEWTRRRHENSIESRIPPILAKCIP
ncbi:DUF6544 family protein [Rhodococcus sp. NPDC058639]|uniref:DUF6544 family protein n=1 Tax=Rhodococcus sp. NPDC058639 TaxID=3346570 RepID=UPI00365BF4CB